MKVLKFTEWIKDKYKKGRVGGAVALSHDQEVDLYIDYRRKAQNLFISDEQIERADMWYCLHKNHVNKLYHLAKNAFPPTLDEDKNNPALWKAGHWKWYIDNYR